MEHDFVSDVNDFRTSSTGAACTNIGGIMDYRPSPSLWSPCSVEDFNKYFNEKGGLTGQFCLANNDGNNTHPFLFERSEFSKASSQKQVLEIEILKMSSRKQVLESEFSKVSSQKQVLESEFLNASS
jgi:hypothetical protein